MNFKQISLVLFLGSIFAFVGCSSSDDEHFSSEKKIIKFVINEVEGVVNEEAHTVTISLPYGTVVTNLNPVIQISDKAKINPGSEITVDLTSAVTYTVTAEDDSKQAYVVTATTSAFEPKITSINRNKFVGGDVIKIDGYFPNNAEENIVSLINAKGESTVLTEVSTAFSALYATIPTTLEFGEYTLALTSYPGKSYEGSVKYEESKVEVVNPHSVAPKILTVSPTKTIARIDNLIHITTENRVSLDGKDYAGVYYTLNGGVKQTARFVKGENDDDFFIDLTYQGLGTFSIYLEHNGYESQKVDVVVESNPYATPTIASVSNYNPMEGEEITIKGTGFSKVSDIDTYIKIDKVADPGYVYPHGNLTNITVVDDTTIKCVLPFVDVAANGQFPGQIAGEIKIAVVANGDIAYHHESIIVKKK